MSLANTVSKVREVVTKGDKFTMVTAYDATFASLLSKNGVDLLLIGDSLGMVSQGHNSTLPVTVADMVYHTQSVARGNQGSMLIADLPFNSYNTVEQALETAGKLMQAGAHMVKLEGGAWLCDAVTALGNAGIPTCIHLGLTPQSVNKLGGFKVQGRDEGAAQKMIRDAVALAEAGADFFLLECVPTSVAKAFCNEVDAPVIGIGAGPDTNGQVLVCYDMLGLTQYRLPRFVKNYMATANTWENAVQSFVAEVKSGDFPNPEHGFE